MAQPILSRRKAEVISNGVFLASIGILFWTNGWWPGILLAIWASLGTRQYLTGRIFDVIVSSIILVGLFIASFFNLSWSVLIPVLFITGGIYIIFREYSLSEDTENEDVKKGLEDDK